MRTSPLRHWLTIISLTLQVGSPLFGADAIVIRPAVELQFQVERSTGYQVQTSTDLTQWQDLGNAVHASAGSISNLLPAGDGAARYFRLETTAVRDLSSELAGIRTQYNVPALGCAVVISNRIVGLAVAGVRKHGASEPVTIRDRWHHGSLTKSMTATLAGIMVDEGTLTFSTKVVDVFPEFGGSMHTAWKTVTLEQLLSHRSGAPGDLGPSGLWTQLWNHPGTPREQRVFLVQSLTALAPSSPPGTAYEYSNAGYMIAGAMLEKLAGRPWEDLITEKLFVPLGMTSAGFGVPATPRFIDQPWGHQLVGNAITPKAPGLDSDNPAGLGPAGTVHCTLLDMARYAAFHAAGDLGDGRLLQPATFQKLHTDVAGQGYALGWSVVDRPWANGKVLQHNGSNQQWLTSVWIGPNKRFAVVVVTNLAGTSAQNAVNAAVTLAIQQFL